MDNSRVLKIYSDKSYLPDNDRHTILLYPFWGEPAGIDDGVDSGRFDDYISSASEYMTLVPLLKDADVAVLPFEWKSRQQAGKKYDRYLRLASSLEQEALRYHKKLVVFFNNDSDEAIPLDNVVVFRTSFYRSTRRLNEHAVPGWSIDFLHTYLQGKSIVREKKRIPVVCYSGYVDYDADDITSIVMHNLKILLGWKPTIGHTLRGEAVRNLKRDNRVTLNFLRRKGFSGGCDEITRREYVSNLVESDYALVIRGAGNFSYRLYEVISCGRIPVFIDTDCVLPFSHIIDWKKYCIWIHVSEINQLTDIILDFHEKISQDEFKEMQLAVRRLYEEWISPVGFYKNLWRCIFC